jgi:hypothetical protein
LAGAPAASHWQPLVCPGLPVVPPAPVPPVPAPPVPAPVEPDELLLELLDELLLELLDELTILVQ